MKDSLSFRSKRGPIIDIKTLDAVVTDRNQPAFHYEQIDQEFPYQKG